MEPQIFSRPWAFWDGNIGIAEVQGGDLLSLLSRSISGFSILVGSWLEIQLQGAQILDGLLFV